MPTRPRPCPLAKASGVVSELEMTLTAFLALSVASLSTQLSRYGVSVAVVLAHLSHSEGHC